MNTVLLSLYDFLTLSSMVFYFAVFIFVRANSLIDNKYYKSHQSYLPAFVFLMTSYLLVREIDVINLLILSEILFYCFSLFNKFNFIKSKEVIVTTSITATLLIISLFYDLHLYVAKVNLNYYLTVLFVLISVFVTYSYTKREEFEINKLHILNALSVLILMFVPSIEGLVFTAVIRIVFFALTFRALIMISKQNYLLTANKLKKFEDDFEDIVRRKVNSQLFYMELSREEMTKLSKLDDMSGTYNKKTMLEFMDSYISSTAVDTFSLLIFDIDNFKGINDNLGHITGDKCIKKLSLLAKEVVRGADKVGRFGGDEFMILLSGANLESAVQVAERFRKKVEKTREPNFTISIGIANYPVNADNKNDLIEYADKGLYIAKNKGRNSLGYYNANVVSE